MYGIYLCILLEQEFHKHTYPFKKNLYKCIPIYTYTFYDYDLSYLYI